MQLSWMVVPPYLLHQRIRAVLMLSRVQSPLLVLEEWRLLVVPRARFCFSLRHEGCLSR